MICTAIYIALKAKKLHNKAVLSFYLSSFIVVFLRCLLFMDPFAHYCMMTFVVILISLPTYTFLLTGFSLFLMILESILKYNNLQTRENTNLT
jgi:hypothetical protein